MEEEYSPAELIEERQRLIDEMNGLVALPKGTPLQGRRLRWRCGARLS
jgi:hypothetical protein